MPIPQEGLIGTSPMLTGAVMFGRGRDQCGIILEPTPEHAINPNDGVEVPNFRNAVWWASLCWTHTNTLLNVTYRPIVEEANHIAPTFARIFKEMIIIADEARPFPRAAKGTIVRKQTLALYQKEIDDL